jgi:peptide/nickel transport system permease protein
MGFLGYLLKRVLLSIPVIILISIVCFGIIQLPPGDYASAYAAVVEMTGGGRVSPQLIEQIRERYALDKPFYVQYWKWIKGFPVGDFGVALSFPGATVNDLLRERLPLTIILNLCALLVALAIAIPIGLYSATHKYSIMDYFLTFIAFLGISVPGFITAVLILSISIFWLGSSYTGGLFSQQYVVAPWSWDRLANFLVHLPAPVIAIAVRQTSNTMRIMRGNTLDVLGEPYIRTARAKGLKESAVRWKHAARISINPIVSRVGVYLPQILATEMLVSIVLNLKTIGPLFYKALTNQDMYLAGTILLVISVILVIGNLIADALLAWLDPRIRLELK